MLVWVLVNIGYVCQVLGEDCTAYSEDTKFGFSALRDNQVQD